MTNKELQDALNGRLEKFDGEKYTGKEASKHVRPIEKTIKSVVREASRKERILCSST